jgi:opacity protein-like surface antigen
LYYLKGNVEADAVRDASHAGVKDIEYQMDLETTRLMLEIAVTAFSWEDLSVFGIGGAGYAWNKTHYQTKDDVNAETLESESDGQFGFAYQFGGGLTYLLADDWALTAEYLWTQLNDLTLSESGDIAGKSTSVNSDEFNATVQTVLIGFRFMM